MSALFLALGAAAFGLMALSDALTVLYKRPWGGRLFAAGGALLALSTAGLLALRGLPRLRALGWWALAALALALLGYTLLAALQAAAARFRRAPARCARLSIPASMRCAATRAFCGWAGFTFLPGWPPGARRCWRLLPYTRRWMRCMCCGRTV